MRGHRLMRSLAAAISLVALVVCPAHAQTAPPETSTPVPDLSSPSSLSIPFFGISEELEAVRQDLDSATTRAMQLETEITALDEDIYALDARIKVTAARIVDQRIQVEAAGVRLAEAEERFRKRLIEVYKRGSFDSFSLLLTSETLTELVSRAAVLTRIAEEDNRVVADLNVAAAEARYQEAALTDLQEQDRILQQEQEERRLAVGRLLKDQESLIAQLTVESREALLRARTLTAETRTQWRLCTIPVGTVIPRTTVTLDARPDVQYIISGYMPRHYQSTGETLDAVCSWYGPGFNGRGTASGQVFNEDDLTCASRTLPFGTVLALTRSERRVLVYVNDRGPYITGRDLDLSKAAAEVLGFDGVATVHAEIVTPVQ